MFRKRAIRQSELARETEYAGANDEPKASQNAYI